MARFLHTRIRVGDLDRSADWYCTHLGFVVKSRTDKSPAGNHVAHLELPGNEHTYELTWSADYDLKVPEDLMHIAIAVSSKKMASRSGLLAGGKYLPRVVRWLS